MDLKKRLIDGHPLFCHLKLDTQNNGWLYWRADVLGQHNKVAVRVLAYNRITGQLALVLDGIVFHVYILQLGNKAQRIQLVERGFKKAAITVAGSDPVFTGARRSSAIAGSVLESMYQVDKKDRIRSPLTGRVVRLLVNEGDFVKQGTQLISIESMKMENLVYADNDMFIKSILIGVGDVVQANQDLMIFDAKRGYDECSTESAVKEKV